MATVTRDYFLPPDPRLKVGPFVLREQVKAQESSPGVGGRFLKVYTSTEIDPTFAPTRDPSRYQVRDSIGGTFAVVSVSILASRFGIELEVAEPLPDARLTVYVSAGTIRSEGQVLNQPTELPFRGLPASESISASEVHAVVVVPIDDRTLRVWTSATIDPAHIPASLPASYMVSSGIFGISVDSVELEATAVVLHLHTQLGSDTAGNVKVAKGALRSLAGAENEEETLAFRTLPAPGPGPDPEPPPPPVVSDFTPEAGATLTAQDDIAFSVTSESGIEAVIVWVRFDALGQVELAYDGTTWRGFYLGGVEPIEGGFRYRFHRSPGWRSPPSVVVYAVSGAGEEVLRVH